MNSIDVFWDFNFDSLSYQPILSFHIDLSGNFVLTIKSDKNPLGFNSEMTMLSSPRITVAFIKTHFWKL